MIGEEAAAGSGICPFSILKCSVNYSGEYICRALERKIAVDVLA